MTSRPRYLCLFAALLLACGCGRSELDTRYASLSPGSAEVSVNGLGVWSELLRRQGHQVRRTRKLTPTVFRRADCIVWFARQYTPPGPREVRWLDAWLSARPDRVLVVVLPDADLAWVYWDKAARRVPAGRRAALQAEKRQALADFRSHRPNSPGPITWPWFRFLPRPQSFPPQPAEALRGRSTWLQGVDASKAEVYVCGTLLPLAEPTAERFQVVDEEMELLAELLSDEDSLWLVEAEWLVEEEPVEQSVVLRCKQGLLALEQQRLDGRVLALINGSFLLNLGLVNPENRKLAWALARELEACPTIYFVDSPAGLEIGGEKPFEYPSFVQLLTKPPVNHLLGHLLLLAVLVCCALWPQWGRPLEPPSEETTDFGRHVEALGRLLATSPTGSDWARRRLQQYRQLREEIGSGSVQNTARPKGTRSLLDSS